MCSQEQERGDSAYSGLESWFKTLEENERVVVNGKISMTHYTRLLLTCMLSYLTVLGNA